ncbi:MAG: hypothetical protein ACYTBZ_27090, partial [Planctomycetota bacterium]
MCKKLIYLIFFMVILVLAGEPVWGADLAVYYDEVYPTHWVDRSVTTAARDYLVAAGYTELDADALKVWMDAHIPNGSGSVVVFAQDVVPRPVAELPLSTDCTIRKYLDAGGKVVFYGDIPFYNTGNSDGTETNHADAGAPAVLGFDTSDTGIRGSGNTVTITAAGVDWGLTQTWPSIRPTNASVATAENLTVLATDDAGHAPAWVKHYVSGDDHRGFVRLFDLDVPGSVPVGYFEDIKSVAEYRLGPNPYPSDPTPEDGSTIDGFIYISNIYVVMNFEEGDWADSHVVYFSDDETLVSNLDPCVSLGGPPDPLKPTEFFAGVPLPE